MTDIIHWANDAGPGAIASDLAAWTDDPSQSVLTMAVARGRTARRIRRYDTEWHSDTPLAEAVLALLRTGGNLCAAADSDTRCHRLFVWADGHLSLSAHRQKGDWRLHSMCAYTAHDTLHEQLETLAIAWFRKRRKARPKPVVHTIVAARGGYEYGELGAVPAKLYPGNYAPEVVAGFERAVREFRSKSPSGRLLLLEGLPGTGKTWLIRVLVNRLCDRARVVMVPTHLVERLADPSFISLLIAHAHQPTVLVLEDCDACLLRRESRKDGSMTALAALLNLSDGIVGAALDLRLVATTNAKVVDIDDALLRDGRLVERITLDWLSAEQASAAFVRIAGMAPTGKALATLRSGPGASLATVCALARKAKCEAPQADGHARECVATEGG